MQKPLETHLNIRSRGVMIRGAVASSAFADIDAGRDQSRQQRGLLTSPASRVRSVQCRAVAAIHRAITGRAWNSIIPSSTIAVFPNMQSDSPHRATHLNTFMLSPVASETLRADTVPWSGDRRRVWVDSNCSITNGEWDVRTPGRRHAEGSWCSEHDGRVGQTCRHAQRRRANPAILSAWRVYRPIRALST